MKGKQVLLTGGTGGLGLGVTPAVIAQGADVTIPYRSPKDVERLKEIISLGILLKLTLFLLIYKMRPQWRNWSGA
jgi:NAD(P)-dependent dehydrogenase (short-subunit alcohol dehydrogenase family)